MFSMPPENPARFLRILQFSHLPPCNGRFGGAHYTMESNKAVSEKGGLQFQAA